MRALELIGRRFERLLVLSRAGKDNQGRLTWICRCACGTLKVVRGSHLKDGQVKSCGCLSQEWKPPLFENLVGRQFERLTVLSRHQNDKHGGATWLCRCSCGAEKIIGSSPLLREDTRSCGCLSRESAISRNKTRVGPKNSFWKGGITPIGIKIRGSDEYKNWRTAVFNRDNFTCQDCGVRGCKLQAHHIKSFSAFPELRFEISNGQTLCVPCHKKTPSYLRHYGNKNHATRF